MSRQATVFDRPLPEDVDAERFVLGALLTDQEAFGQIAELITADDLSLEKHCRIFQRAADLYSRGESITTVSVWREP